MKITFLIFFVSFISSIKCQERKGRKIYIKNTRKGSVDILGGTYNGNGDQNSSPELKFIEDAFASLDKQKEIQIPESPYFGDDYHKNSIQKSLFDTYGAVIRNKRAPITPISRRAKKKSQRIVKNIKNKKNNKINRNKNINKNTKNNKRNTNKKINTNNKRNPIVKQNPIVKRKPIIKQNPIIKRKPIIKRNPIKKIVKNNNRNKGRNNAKKKRNKREVPGKRVRRLVGANDATIENYPYVVSIQNENEHWCTGALLNQRLVITTANCFWKSDDGYSRMIVRAGSTYTHKGGQLAKILEVRRHPNWSIRRNPRNDVALVLLDRLLQFGPSIHGIDLPNRRMRPTFEDAYVTSFGSIRRDGIFSPGESNMQVYYAKLVSNEFCNNITRKYGVYVNDGFFCLTQYDKRSPCTRDTGAPAVSDGVAWGLASWGIRKFCGNQRFPSMFSYLGADSNVDFILNATAHLMSEQRIRPFYASFDPGAKESWAWK